VVHAGGQVEHARPRPGRGGHARRLALVAALVAVVAADPRGAEADPGPDGVDPPIVLRADTLDVPLAGRGAWAPARGGDDVVEVAADRARFTPLAPGQVKLAARDHATWFRAVVENAGDAPTEWQLELWTVPHREARLYVVEGGRVVATVEAPWPPTRVVHRLDVAVPPGAPRTLLVRVEGARPAVAPVAIGTPTALADRDASKQLAMGLFFGVGLALVLYNGFLALALRERAYAVYVAYALGTWGLILGENGYVDVALGPWLAPLGLRWSSLGAAPLGAVLSTSVAFTSVFFGEVLRRRSRRLLVVVAGVAALAGLASIVDAHAGFVLELAAVGCITSMLGVGALAWQRGHGEARHYLVAWSALFVPVVAWLAEGWGLVSQSWFTRYAGELGVSLEMVLMSLALAHKLSAARDRALEAAESHGRALAGVGAEQRLLAETADAARRAAEALSASRAAFLVKVSHELRTPVHHVVGLAQLLGATPLDAEQRGHLEDLERAGAHLTTLIDRLLVLQRADAAIEAPAADAAPQPEVARFAPRALAEAVAARHAPDATTKGLPIEVRAHVLPGDRVGDVEALERVLEELVANAVRFTEAGLVRVVVYEASASRLAFIVEDTGPGVPDAALAGLFEGFRQLDDAMTRAHGGLGIGLAVAEREARRLGGRLRLGPRPGGGTIARFTVPLARAPRAA
jgi:signal transduction histidine kinase